MKFIKSIEICVKRVEQITIILKRYTHKKKLFVFFNWLCRNMLCLFHVVAPTLAPLVYEADHSTQVRLRDYVVSHVFTDLEEDEPEEEDGK